MKPGDLIKSIDFESFSNKMKKRWTIGIVIRVHGKDNILVMWQTGKITYANKGNIWELEDERLQ